MYWKITKSQDLGVSFKILLPRGHRPPEELNRFLYEHRFSKYCRKPGPYKITGYAIDAVSAQQAIYRIAVIIYGRELAALKVKSAIHDPEPNPHYRKLDIAHSNARPNPRKQYSVTRELDLAPSAHSGSTEDVDREAASWRLREDRPLDSEQLNERPSNLEANLYTKRFRAQN